MKETQPRDEKKLTLDKVTLKNLKALNVRSNIKAGRMAATPPCHCSGMSGLSCSDRRVKKNIRPLR